MPEFDPVFSLGQIDGSNGYLIASRQSDSRFGEWVSSAGDVNGDGFEDIIISAEEYDYGAVAQAGAAYVVFGGAANLAALDAAESATDGRIDTTHFDGYNGFVLHGVSSNAEFGQNVAGAGDVDGDGFDDLLVSSVQGGAGRVHLLFGQDSFAAIGPPVLLGGSLGYLFLPAGPNSGDNLGYSLAGIGDFNGDGLDDFVLGADEADADSGIGDSSEGAAYLIFGGLPNLMDIDDDDGSAGGAIRLQHLDTGEGTTFASTNAGDETGFNVSGLGDVNNDGFADFGVTAPLHEGFSKPSNSGAGFVVFGRPDSIGVSDQLRQFHLNGVQGFEILGLSQNDRLGEEITGGGDINGDGYDDIIVSAPRADPYGT